MKKTLAIVAVVAVLGIGSVASAHMFGWGGGYGKGGHMTGYGYGPMMGYGYGTEGNKYLDETADLRREFNTKQFEYFEALRTGDEKKAETIAKELNELTGKVSVTAPRGRYFATGGYGTEPYCW